MSWLAPFTVTDARRKLERHVNDGTGECLGCRERYGQTTRHPCWHRTRAEDVIRVFEADTADNGQ